MSTWFAPTVSAAPPLTARVNSQACPAAAAGCHGGHSAAAIEPDLVRLDDVARRGGGSVEVRRIAEHVQLDPALMADLHKVDAVPGNIVEVGSLARSDQHVVLSGGGSTVEVDGALARAVLARRR